MTASTNDNCECRVTGGGFVFCHLHRAAHELLEALYLVLHSYKAATSNFPDDKIRKNIIASAREAIAKAEGRD